MSFSLLATTAGAGSRYGTPPPVIMSADLTAPWVMQLRAKQTRSGLPATRLFQSSVPLFQTTNQRAGLFGFSQYNFGPNSKPKPRFKPRYATLQRQPRAEPSINSSTSSRKMDPKFLPRMVSYSGNGSPGSIVIDTSEKFLYLVMGDGRARRYGVGVGKSGFEWSGTNNISRKAEWPDWRPPAQMIAREKKKGRILPAFVEGGPHNPLGARALYLGSTLYRIHGTNSPWTIGQAVSSGCIRMRNEDVMDLYERVSVGAKVIVG